MTVAMWELENVELEKERQEAFCALYPTETPYCSLRGPRPMEPPRAAVEATNACYPPMVLECCTRTLVGFASETERLEADVVRHTQAPQTTSAAFEPAAVSIRRTSLSSSEASRSGQCGSGEREIGSFRKKSVRGMRGHGACVVEHHAPDDTSEWIELLLIHR
ncbi:hypothetical protein BAUCODRAFT_467994 [Baudoinia panamericana UAMH 10762]|uniref:Uncharacterized protein n=1 Tax=Baudoinia panamericana (strain UAMH 10762) TaxID=717646 RepID=M2LPF4_BAUPA|nr:uncharacterized protein BAUCODRAFT_467994 [Baudoinia panamericana UAMH 10762]EMC96272.1 hypothetical protein BAUCODRAFT_467994 [Baudoinia panamericana UAMH 10762]